jgi:hypothetical protein
LPRWRRCLYCRVIIVRLSPASSASVASRSIRLRTPTGDTLYSADDGARRRIDLQHVPCMEAVRTYPLIRAIAEPIHGVFRRAQRRHLALAAEAGGDVSIDDAHCERVTFPITVSTVSGDRVVTRTGSGDSIMPPRSFSGSGLPGCCAFAGLGRATCADG